MESCERATSDFFSAMSSSKGYWYSLFDLDDTSFSLSQLFGVSIEELFDVFQTIGFMKKVGEKGLQFMRFKFTNFINQNGLDEFVEHNLWKFKGKKEHFIRIGHRRYKTGTKKALLPQDTVAETPPRIKGIAGLREEFAKKLGAFLTQKPSSLSSTIPLSALDPDEQEEQEQEQKRRKWLVFELQTKLLPLLSPASGSISESLLESSVDSKKVEEVIYSLVGEMQRQREATLTLILGTRKEQGSPYARLNLKHFPVLESFGIPVDDARVHENIFR